MIHTTLTRAARLRRLREHQQGFYTQHMTDFGIVIEWEPVDDAPTEVAGLYVDGLNVMHMTPDQIRAHRMLCLTLRAHGVRVLQAQLAEVEL